MIVTVTPNPVLDRTLTVPNIDFDAVLRAADVRLDWGGKGFNVSRTLGALDTKSVAMGFVGGATGKMVEEGLNRLQIGTDFVRIDGETRTNIVITDGRHHIKVNEAGPQVGREACSELFQRVRQRLSAGDICLMAGSLPPGVPPTFYADLIHLLHEIGAISVLDASGEALRLGIQAGPTLVKPNALEVSELLGLPVQSAEDGARAASALLQGTTKMAAVSLGADGLILVDGDGGVLATPPVIEERNAVGAGDALAAGLIWALARALPLDEVARWGVAAGTAAAATPGVQPGSRGEIEAIYAAVKVSPLRSGV